MHELLLQACRGTKVDCGVAFDQVDGYALSYVIPTQADILIAFSTMEGTQRVAKRKVKPEEIQCEGIVELFSLETQCQGGITGLPCS
jgi:hypothetical protein